MREIKFRAWDKSQNRMVYDFETVPYYDSRVITKYNIDKCMQYMGLKDKNGVEIYEGDIIKYDFNKFNYRIEFLNAEFIARRFYENIENLYPSEFDYGKECEVIGNIYENKDLLSEVK